MARATGPLLSLDASGSIAGAVTFSKWKGRNYVRQLVIPKNPKSAKQLGVRAMMKYLAQIWASIGAVPKASWDDLAAAKNISPFNAFTGENLARWQSNDGPTHTYPAAEANTPGAVTTNVPTGHAGYATIAVLLPVAADRVGFILCRDTAEITVPGWHNAILAFPDDGTAHTVTVTDSPLEPATYHYRAAAFTDDGVIGTYAADASAEVT